MSTPFLLPRSALLLPHAVGEVSRVREVTEGALGAGLALIGSRARQPLLSFTLALLCCTQALAQTQVANKPYTKAPTRLETREAFLKSLNSSIVSWGRWMGVGPFDHPKGAKDIAAPFPPEDLLSKMKAGAAEPLGPADRRPTYDAQGGTKIEWKELAQSRPAVGAGEQSTTIDLEKTFSSARVTKACCYLYRSIEAPRDMDLPVRMGSDDGLRVWLNADLIVDVNAERPMSPESEQPILKLKKGPNHLLVKVSQGAGEWQFALSADPDLDPVIEAALDWQLDTDFPTLQSKHYRTATIPHPADVSLEVGGLDVLTGSNNPIASMKPTVAVCTRRGDVFLIDGVFETPSLTPTFKKAASGLQEPLGFLYSQYGPDTSNLQCFVAQRGELTKLVDSNFDGVVDSYTTVSDDWKVSGNYHEYAFGPKLGPGRKLYVNLNLAHTDVDATVMGALVPTRGSCVAIDPLTGRMEEFADGLRSPDGLCIYDNQLFFTDNQGDYVATNKLSWVRKGSFHGHQSSLKFRDGYGPDWKKNGKPVPEITWPAVWFPYQKMGQSTTDGIEITSDKFGPFKGQLLVGEQTTCDVNRVFLEKVSDGKGGLWYQGACFPFLKGFASGVHRLCLAPDGSLLVGMTDRGWGSTGPKRDGLQRVIYSGNLPFEILSMKISPNGFMLEFTREVDAAAATTIANYSMTSYTYNYHPNYGSPETDTKPVKIMGAQLLQGSRIVALTCDGMRSGGMGYVHELHIKNLTCKAGADGPAEELLHPVGYYTVQHIPKPE